MQGCHVAVSPAKLVGQSTKQARSTGQLLLSDLKAHLSEQQQSIHGATKRVDNADNALDLQYATTETLTSGVARLDTTVSAPKPVGHAESAAPMYVCALPCIYELVIL